MKDNALRGIKHHRIFIRCAFHHTLVDNMLYTVYALMRKQNFIFFIETMKEWL